MNDVEKEILIVIEKCCNIVYFGKVLRKAECPMIVIRPKRLAPFVDKIIWQGKGATEPYIVYPDIYNVMGFQNLGHINGGKTSSTRLIIFTKNRSQLDSGPFK